MCSLRGEQYRSPLPTALCELAHQPPLSPGRRSGTTAGFCIVTPKGGAGWDLLCPSQAEPKCRARQKPLLELPNDELTSLEIFCARLKKITLSSSQRKGQCNEGGKQGRREELIRREQQTRLEGYKLALPQSLASAAALLLETMALCGVASPDLMHRETSRSEQPTNHCANESMFQRLPFEQ